MNTQLFFFSNGPQRIGGVLTSMLISSTIDRGFKLRLRQTKDYPISIVEVINW